MKTCTYFYNNKKYSRDRLLRVLIGEGLSLVSNDQAESIQWLKNKLGMTDSEIKVVEGLIDNKSLGQLQQDSSILLSEFAFTSVAYHEAFHRVFNGFLSPTERKEFISQFKGRKDYKSLMEKYRDKYGNNENLLIEEYLADEFADYVLSDGKMKIEQPMKSWFQRLLDFIKKLVGLTPTDINTLYSRINNGKYKGKVKYKVERSANKILIGDQLIGAGLKNEIVQSISTLMLNSIIKSGPTYLRNFIKHPESVNGWNTFKGAANAAAQLISKTNEQIGNAIAVDIIQAINSGSTEDSRLFSYVKEYISNLGIDLSDETNIAELEKQESSMSDNDSYTGANGEFSSNLEIDPKTNMSKQIKIVLGSLYDKTNLNSLGLPTSIQWSTAFNELTQHMSGVPTEEFMNELSLFNKPYVGQLLSYINKDDKDTLIFRNDFISTMANTINNFNILSIKEGSIYLFDANVNTRTSKVKQDWQNGLQLAIKSFDSFNDWKSAIKDLSKKANPSLEDFKQLFGIELSKEIINSVVYSNGGNNFYPADVFRQVAEVISKSKFSETNQPDYTKLFREFDIEGSINNLAGMQSNYENAVDMMVYAMSKKLYGVGLNTHMTTQINRTNYAISKFTPEMSIEDKTALLRKYAPFVLTKFNEDSLYLQRILEGKKIKLNIIYNAQTELGEESEVSQLDESDLYSLHLNAVLQGTTMSMKHSDRSTFFGISFEGVNEPFIDPFAVGVKNKEGMLNTLTNYLVQQIEHEVEVSRSFNEDNYQAIQYFADGSNKPGLSSILGDTRALEVLKGSELNDNDRRAIALKVSDSFSAYKEELESWGVLNNNMGINAELLAPDKYAGDVDFIIASSFVNEIIGHNEEAKFFSGDLRSYKDSVDLFKRLAAISSTGKLLVNDQATNDFIRQETAKTIIQFYNPETNRVEEFNYPLAPDGQMRGLTVKENEKFESHLIQPLESNSGLTGKPESKIFMVYEVNFAKDFSLDYSTMEASEKTRWESIIRNYESKYSGINENDGQSYMNIIAFKNYMIRLGQWTPGMENVFKTEMAILSAKSIEDIANVIITINGQEFKPFEIPENESFRERNLEVEGKKGTVNMDPLHTLKSQYSGPTVAESYAADRTEFDFMFNSIFKTSYHILLPSAIIGTNLQLMNLSMLSNGVDVIHMGSANKVGGVDPKVAAKKALEQDKDNADLQRISEFGLEFYDAQGRFNTNDVNNHLDKFAYLADVNYMKDQVKIGNKVKDSIKGSTQSLKILISNLIVNGVERIPGAQSIVDKYKAIIASIVADNQAELFKQLDYTGKEFNSLTELRKVLIESALAKSAPENLFNAIENFIDDPILETLPNKTKIENILYSIITNRLISFDRPGNSYPQAAVTGYEPIGSRTQTEVKDKKGKHLSAQSNQSVVAFYNPVFVNGILTKVDPAEVIMPLPDYWVEPILRQYNTRNLVVAINRLNADIASGKVKNEVTFKGLRIPNQQLSSNDIFKVKRFGLPTMQNYIIVPTEIVVKVGSDFDIDKLSIYFPVMKPFTMKVDQSDDYTKLLELEKEILLHPDNAHHLFMPVVDDIFAQDAYSEIYQQLEGSPMEEEKSIFSSLTPQTNVNKSIIFVKGKLGVGIVARDITGQSVGQADGLTINQNYITIEDGEKKTNPTMLFFEGLEDNYFLSNYTSSSNRIISEVLSQLMTTQVDNVKNPVGVKLGINMQTLSIVGYLTRRGIDPKLMIKFIKQPLILEYLKAQKLNESLINKNNGDELMKSQLIEKVLRSKGYREKVPYTVAALGDWRINNAELNKGLTERKFDQEQLRMFSYFLELVNQTRMFSKWTNDQTADTTGLKDRSSVEAMMQNKEESIQGEFIDPVLQTLISATGVISPFTKARDNYDSMWSEFYFTVNSLYKDRILAFKTQLAGLQRTKAKKEKALSTIDNDFILFFVHNFALKDQSTFEQLTGKTEVPSLAQRIKDAKKVYPDNLVLKAFFPIVKSKLDETDNQYIDSLRLFERQLTTIDINDFIDSMRDIADADLQLYKDLVTFVFYQSGLNNSPFNYSNIVPIANNKLNSPEYEKLFSSILQQAVANAKQVVTNDAQADVVFDQFVNAFLHNNKQFLRSKSYSTYPYTLLNKFDRVSKKSKLYDNTLGEFIPELGNTYMKRYNMNLFIQPDVTNQDVFTPNEKVGSDVNIYFGTNENKELSNLASRPFVFENRRYYSVEHAYQSLKSGEFDDVTYNRYKSGGVKLTGNKGTKTENNWNLSLMKDLIRSSLSQNPNILQRLLDTGKSKITHNQDNGMWKTEFPRILMELRDEMKIQSKQLDLFTQDINKEEISKNGEVTDDTLYQEVLTNFETYFPDKAHFNNEQREFTAQLVVDGTIQITCKFG